MTSEKKHANFLAYCGAHYKACPVEIRELWAKAVSQAGDLALLKEVFEAHARKPLELVPISTCNRFDICVLGDVSEEALLGAFAELASRAARGDQSPNGAGGVNAGADSDAARLAATLTPERLRSFLRWSFDQDAVVQLLRVAASLDSLVLGEPHILGQLKDAYMDALKSGLCGSETTALFNRCFQVAKRVRTETELGRNGISIGHAAVEVARRVFESLSSQRALVVGAGEMARIAAQHFRACGVADLTIANRTLANADRLAAELGDTRSLSLDAALAQLARYDVMVIATASPSVLVDFRHVRSFPKERGGRPCVIVDISVPRNVDPRVAQADNVFAFDVDDLDKIMESNRESRRLAAQSAEAIIQSEVHALMSDRRARESLVNVGRFHAWVRTVVENEIDRSFRGKASLTRASASVIADAVAKKLVSPSAAAARSGASLETAESIGDALELLFRLSDQPALNEIKDAKDTQGNKVVSLEAARAPLGVGAGVASKVSRS